MFQKEQSESLTNENEALNNEFKQALQAVRPTEYLKINAPFGFFDYDDIYDELIAETEDGDTIVEIGSWIGKSTVYMAERVRLALAHGKNIKFINIDPFIADCTETAQGFGWVNIADNATKHKTRDVFYRHIEPVKDYVETIEGFSVPVSEQFENESIFAVWVDGDHAYESVLADCEAWFPKIRKGGILAGHDYDIPAAHSGFDVPRAIFEFSQKYQLNYVVNHKSWIIYK